MIEPSGIIASSTQNSLRRCCGMDYGLHTSKVTHIHTDSGRRYEQKLIGRDYKTINHGTEFTAQVDRAYISTREVILVYEKVVSVLPRLYPLYLAYRQRDSSSYVVFVKLEQSSCGDRGGKLKFRLQHHALNMSARLV